MYIEVAAHRGNVAEFPENTMPAFRSAYDIGVDMIELDMHMTKDGEIVLIHDDNLARTTDVSGRIRDLTLEEIRRADAGIKKGEQFKGTRVPTLREFCEYVAAKDNTMQFNFEFKDYFRNGEEWAKESTDKAIAIIDNYGLWDRSLVNSFDGALLKYVEEKYDGRFRLHGFYPYNILGEVRPKKLSCACMWRKNPDGTPAFDGVINPKSHFDALIADGVRPAVGAFVRTIEDMQLAVEYGAYLITSNEPAFMMEELKKVNLRNRG